jgi:RNA 3'-terminal phosphate cyclase (ATP)
MSERLIIDGSQGEGGGQILRTAIALSLATGRPFRIERIRAGRAKPGLLRQHLTAVHAAVAISGGRASGADLGSSALDFEPGQVRGGDYRLAVGTAGSATLVLQAVLPALLLAREPSRLTLEGGTHNPAAPPFDFLALALLPLLRRMGARVEASFQSHGFYPAGGGRFTVAIEPCERLAPLTLVDRGPVEVRARALVASLPTSIAYRELALVRERLNLDRSLCRAESVPVSVGPGNVLMVEVHSAQVTEVMTGFGVKGVRAERVATDVTDAVEAYLAADVPVGPYLADQLLVPLTLAGSGTFHTGRPTSHTTTNAGIIGAFVKVPIAIDEIGGGKWGVRVGPRP